MISCEYHLVNMRLIKQKTDYAIRVLKCLSCHQDVLQTGRDLSERLQVPLPFLRGILQQLHKEGFCDSYKGKGGGFRLKFEADGIKVMDVIEVMQGPIKLHECKMQSGQPCGDHQNCQLRRQLIDIEHYVYEKFDGLMISQV